MSLRDRDQHGEHDEQHADAGPERPGGVERPRCAASCGSPSSRRRSVAHSRWSAASARTRCRRAYGEVEGPVELGEVGVDESVVAHAVPAMTASTAAVKPRHSSLRSRSVRSPARVIA